MSQRPRLRSFDEASTWELLRRLGLYLGRAMRLRCPECGVSRVFMPAARTRGWHDWVTPLDGCPRCGYAYQREGGYFLIATWGVHYFTVTGLCLLAALLVDHFVPMSFTLLAVSVAALTLVFGAWFARYAKSLYLAIDHFFDPHVRPAGGGGGPPAPAGSAPPTPMAPADEPEAGPRADFDAVPVTPRRP
jgi:hypothetical protein